MQDTDGYGVLWRLQQLMAGGYVLPRGSEPNPEKLVLYHPNLGNARVHLFDNGDCEMQDFDSNHKRYIPVADKAGFEAFIAEIKPANFAQNLFGRSSFLFSMIYIFGAAAFLTWLISAMLSTE